ncbi:MAG: ComEA family DNA-binding protein [Clostridia bacterium]|nr:ComEA family DNA-binding protein [Clostridia bacterium]
MEKIQNILRENRKYVYIAVIIMSIITAIFFTSDGTNAQVVEEEPPKDVTIYVDISGEVVNPGVYEMKSSDRIYQVIEKAGGVTKKADLNAINQAEGITDGMKLIIPSKEDSSGKISINKGDAKMLETISGIGPATSEKIINYRKENGGFSKLEDLMKVSGIGEKTFEKMKPYIKL